MIKRGIVIPEYEELMKEKAEELDVPGSDPEAIKKLEEQVKAWKKEAENSAAQKEDKRSETREENSEGQPEEP